MTFIILIKLKYSYENYDFKKSYSKLKPYYKVDFTYRITLYIHI